MHLVLVEVAEDLAGEVLEGGAGRGTVDHSGQLLLVLGAEHLGVARIDW